ncbi:hypothetical protein [Inquilinus limosus]|uniref:hypothetical protein n=1 Tax=Inquilinus limosus TaxID=171674 RepID=UPI0012DD4F2B|nr:hypothetical protein [Inquilinus limosus]
MTRAKPPAAAPTIASDPELVRLERRMQALDELAERCLAEAKALSKEPDKLMETFDRFTQLSDEVLRAIAQSHRLRQQYRRRREKLEAERARRIAAARSQFLAAGSPSEGSRH